MPWPGRLTVKFWLVNFSPFLMEAAATMLLRTIFIISISLLLGFFIGLPMIIGMTRMVFTVALNSCGSEEAWWSGPGRFLSRVKCFSMTQAPRVTAMMETWWPSVWSE